MVNELQGIWKVVLSKTTKTSVKVGGLLAEIFNPERPDYEAGLGRDVAR